MEFDDDVEFAAARNTLDRKCETCKKSTDDAAIKTTPFTKEELTKIFLSPLLSFKTATGLLNGLYFIVGLNTAKRVEWQATVKWSDISETREGDNGLRYKTIPVGVEKSSGWPQL